MAPSLQDDTLIEEKEAKMVEFSSGKPSYRIAHFLKPTFFSSKQAQTMINPPPKIFHPSKPISPIFKSLSSKVRFHGWKTPFMKYKSWVDQLRPSFESTWNKSSILDAIMCSTIEIPKCRASFFTIADKWCSETNTFVLPWGETTITLEDVMVLGGFSVTGDPVFSAISSKEMYLIEEELQQKHLDIRRRKCKKASQQQWMDIWMGNRAEFEHEAFLSYWLSRYVLPPHDNGTINKSVFKLAILLARGTRIALAPAVLARIYRDMRLLKEKIATLIGDLDDQDDSNMSNLRLCAPLQLLQVWIWERFPKLSPKTSLVCNELPIIGKWHKAKILGDDYVGLPIVYAKNEFQWRPYSTLLKKGLFDFDLESYCRFIRASDLVGLDCIEQYLPHRVARQFGLDQDVPIAFRRVCDTRKIAWSSYDRPIGCLKLYKPPEFFESDVTTRYLKWWVESDRKKNINWMREKGNPNVKTCHGTSKVSKKTAKMVGIKMDNNEADEHQPSSKRPRQGPCNSIIDIESSESDPSRGSFSEIKGLKNDDDSIDDGVIDSIAGSPITIDENTGPNSGDGARESSDIDLLDRIAIMQRIIDGVKVAKSASLEGKSNKLASI